MNPLTTIPETVLQPAAWALVHFLWQGAVVALLAAAGLWAFGHRGPRTRYVIAIVGLLLMAILPPATTLYLAQGAGDSATQAVIGVAPTVKDSSTVSMSTATSVVGSMSIEGWQSWPRYFESLSAWLLGCWLLGVLLLGSLHAGGLSDRADRANRR